MHWVYLSPHLDDVVYSCGGLLWEQIAAGEQVAIWTVCAGDPVMPLSPFAQSLHDRWQTGTEAIQVRRAEDIAACQRLKVAFRHLDIPDCIYRRNPMTGEALYASEEAIFGPLHPAEQSLVRTLATQWAGEIPPPTQVVAPLSLGGHVDHRLVVRAARSLAQARQIKLWFYADFPYIRSAMDVVDLLERLGFTRQSWPVSGAAVAGWVEAAAAYVSQISTFWQGLPELERDFRDYAAYWGGGCLWHGPE